MHHAALPVLHMPVKLLLKITMRKSHGAMMHVTMMSHAMFKRIGYDVYKEIYTGTGRIQQNKKTLV